MSNLKNDLFLRAIWRQKVPRTPLWMMRQAGRYLPEYRATRQQAGSFLKLCSTPELACEVTLQPLRRYRLDAAILFSDILTVPQALNLGLEFEAGEGPLIHRPVRTQRDVDALPTVDPERELRYVMDAVRLIRRELDGQVPLIGFAGSPWTVGTYAVEGKGSKTFDVIKKMLYSEPKMLHQLLTHLTLTTADYLTAQIHAGAQAVMIFDTWGGVLTPAAYREFSLSYMQKIIDRLPRNYAGQRIPVILFTKGHGALLAEQALAGADALGVDWTIDLHTARNLVNSSVAIQGNLDPSVLYANPAVIHVEVEKVLKSFGHGEGHVFNLGHGIHPDVNPEHALAMVEAVHELSPQFHVGSHD